MLISELPSTATQISAGVWVDAITRIKYYLDPSDATLVTQRIWTDAEVAAWNQTQAVSAAERASLLVAIGQRVTELRTSATTATAFATSETVRATTVASLPLAQVTPTAIRDELALIHTNLAQISANQKLALNSIADLAVVVSDTI